MTRDYVYGVGINDADYAVYRTEKENGKSKIIWQCPYYRDWCSMLSRAYSTNRGVTYQNVKVCDEWKHFTNFKRWVITQPNKDWENSSLDKDFIGDGITYSPENCVYISKKLNGFITDRTNDRGLYLVGVTWHKHRKIFVAQCANPFGVSNYEKRGYIGGFVTEEEAHEAWRSKKHEYSCKLAEYEKDPRVVNVLRTRYLKGGNF